MSLKSRVVKLVILTILVGSSFHHFHHIHVYCHLIIRPKANTYSAITPPKVNRFGWNLKHCQPNVGGWPWQILGTIRAVSTHILY